jgi:hypothetical protein
MSRRYTGAMEVGLSSDFERKLARAAASGPMPFRRYVLLSLVLLTWTASLGAAQTPTCDSSQFDTLTNMWKFEPDQNTREVTPTELAAERKIMQRVVDMFKSAFVPTGAVGLYGANYDVLPHARLNTNRYGNTYTFTLSNHKIECLNGKPAARDVSLGSVQVLVNLQFAGEATNGDSAVGFSYLPRGYYQLKDKTELPRANAEGIHEFTFANGTTAWWLTRAGALPFRVITRREFLQKQIEILQSKPDPSARIVAYYQQLLSESSDEVAIVKNVWVESLNDYGYVFTTLADSASRVYVTVNPEYYDRRQPKSAPQHIIIVVNQNTASLRSLGNGALHLESMRKLRDVASANLAELRAMVK